MIQDQIYKYFRTNPDLRVLFVFDQLDSINSELCDCEWDDGYRYEVFDGRWFTTKLLIENEWKNDRVVLLFSEVPEPTDTQTMLAFPLMDVLCANMVFSTDNYQQYIQQYNIPVHLAGHIQNHVAELQQTKFSKIIAPYLSSPDALTADMIHRVLLSGYLDSKSLLDWENIIIKYIMLGLPSEESRRSHFFTKLKGNPHTYAVLQNKLQGIFGCQDMPNSEYRMQAVAQSLYYNAITQLCSAVPNDIYKSFKVTNTLAIEAINRILTVAEADRFLRDNFFKALYMLASQIEVGRIVEYYGVAAEYMFMPPKMIWGVLGELMDRYLVEDRELMASRLRNMALREIGNEDIGRAVEFAMSLCSYYDKRAVVEEKMVLNSPEEYVSEYVSEFCQVDLHYRKAVEAYCGLVASECPIHEVVYGCKQRLDADYSVWCNRLNTEWVQCVKEKAGAFGNVRVPKQQDFYKNERQSDKKQAVIVCDAMRYEVATELYRELSGEKHIAEIGYALAMLPTETKYTKNALLPHRSLWLEGCEMAVDGKVLRSLDERSEHLKRYEEGAVCISFNKAVGLSQTEARELFKSPLVYVYYDAIDERGHSGVAGDVTKACSAAVEELCKFITKLQSSYNVSSVLLTSDHGFLFNDITFEERDKHRISEDTVESKSRYFLSESCECDFGLAKFRMGDVSAIESEVFVGVPVGTNRLAAPSGGYAFAHGGASLQEMVIPVIRSTMKRVAKSEKVKVTLLDRELKMVSSRVKFTLIQNEAVSMHLVKRDLVCAVYSGDRQVTAVKEIAMDSADADNIANRTYSVELMLNAVAESNIMELRIYDKDDMINPLICERVINKTLIEQDF